MIENVSSERVKFMLTRQDGLFAALPYESELIAAEQRLFRRVLDRAALDLSSKVRRDKEEALTWFLNADRRFVLVSECAGFEAKWVRKIVFDKIYPLFS